MANFPFNPLPTVVGAGSFNVTTTGYIQGCAMDDPSARQRLRGGTVLSSLGTPMWGGCGITDTVPGTTPNPVLGPVVSFASSVGPATTGQQAAGILTGFSVFDQNPSMIMSPQNPVPLAVQGAQINYYPLGSNARIPVQIDPSVDLEGFSTRSLVSWDFNLQRLVPYVAGYAANVFTIQTRALVSGVYVATGTTTSPHGLVAGDDFVVSGSVPTAYNGSWTAAAGTAGSTIVWSLGTAVDPGAVTTLGEIAAGGGAVGPGVTGGGILPVTILDIQIGNSMVVNLNSSGYYVWNRSGSTALLQI